MFFQRHKFVLLGLIVTLFTAQAPNIAAATNFSISVDGLYNRRLSGDPGHNNASGLALNLQYHPADFISLGASVNGLLYWGIETPNPVLAESVNLTGRFIFNYGDPFTLFLGLEGGINPKIGVGPDIGVWPGEFQLTGGLGGWLFLSSTTALNMMAGYNFIDGLAPGIDPINNIHGRLGFTFFMSPAQKTSTPSVAAPQVPAATPEATAVAEPVQALSINPAPGESKQVEITDTESPNSMVKSKDVKVAPGEGKPVEIEDTELSPAQLKQRELQAKNKSDSLEISKIDQLKDSETAEDKQAKLGETESAGEITPPPPPEEKVSEPAYLGEGKLTEYSVQRRDTLWDISGKGNVYGNHFAWPLIFKANRDMISDPDLIYPEQNFRIGRDFSEKELKKAVDDASKTPAYVPHTKPREALPVDYF